MKEYLIIAMSVMTIIASGCKKPAIPYTPSANLLVANVVNQGGNVTFDPTTQTAANGSYQSFPLRTGQTHVVLTNVLAVPVQVYFQGTLNANSGDNYSLFLSGASPSAIDTVLIKENYHNYTDSLCGIRFINLSPGSAPISVNQTGQANGSEVASLGYKSYSPFKQYPAKAANSSYSFDIRDAASGNLITTYTFSTYYFHNATIVLQGLPGSTGVTLVQHP